MVAVLGGVDSYVFTAGIGEHDATIRAAIVAGLEWLGLMVDNRNQTYQSAQGCRQIGGETVWAMPADEEAEIARQVAALA